MQETFLALQGKADEFDPSATSWAGPAPSDGCLAMPLALDFSRALYSGDGQWSFESGVPAQRKVSHALPDEVRPGPYRGPMSRCLFSTRTEDSIGAQ